MRIAGIVLILQIIGLCKSTDENMNDLDLVKRELALTQFKNKLIEHFDKFNRKHILTGVNHETRQNNRINTKALKFLDRIEEIKVVPKEDETARTKVLIPGLKARKCDKFGSMCMEFLLPDKLSTESIESAKFLLAVKNPNENSIRWKVNLLNMNSKRSSFYHKTHSLYGRIHEMECLNFIRSIVTETSEKNNNRSIKLKFTGRKPNRKAITIGTIILVIGINQSKRRFRRHARQHGPRRCNSSSIFCCMKNFTITSADLNLQNLISPERMQLNYCRGECNNYHNLQSNHAKYIALLRRSKNSRISARQLENMRICCTPKHYDSLEIQYRDDSGVIMTTKVGNMVVTDCRCN